MTLRFSIWLGAFMACMLAALVLALVPAPPPMITTGWDKSNHLLAYGALIEVLQVFTPSRVASGLDLLADGLGILAGWGVAWIAGRARNDNFEGPQ